MIEVINLSYKYGQTQAVDGISFRAKKHSTTAIIGPSGCGKTTLLYIIGGLLDYKIGEIKINGKKVLGVRKSTGIILQNYGLFPWKTVEKNIALGLKNKKLSKNEIKNKTEKIMIELGIEDLIGKYPHQISGGQKQRVAIARTLSKEPDLLLMDEASSALDALTKENIQDLLLEIFHNRKCTMIFITHSIEEATFLGQNIYVMDKGKIKAEFQNKYIGMKNHRKSKEFFEMCTKLREELER